MTITVCMSVYEGKQYIEKQLASILHQTLKPDQVLIWEDGSKDGTRELIEHFLKEHDLEGTWKMLASSGHMGYPKGFYECAKVAKGDVIFWADQDDYWYPEKLQRMLQVMEADSDHRRVLSCDYDLIDEEDKRIRSLLKPGRRRAVSDALETAAYPVSLRQVLTAYRWPGMTLCVNRDWLMERLPVAYELSVAHDFWICACGAGEGCFYEIPQVLVSHRRHKANLAREEHRPSRLLQKSRKLQEIKAYIKQLRELRLLWDHPLLQEKLQFMEGREAALRAGSILQVIKNSLCNRQFFRLATLSCDLWIAKKPVYGLLYICGIDWSWIEQRPQILARGLAQAFGERAGLEEPAGVTVVYPRSLLHCFKPRPKEKELRLRILWTVPLQEKNRVLLALSNLINHKLLRQLSRYPQALLGYPLYERYLPGTYEGKIFYDCMDDYEALYPDREHAYKIPIREQALVERCDTIFVTSVKLRERLTQYLPDPLPIKPAIILVPNGAAAELVREIKAPRRRKEYHFGYIGTIHQWMDYETILYGLEHCSFSAVLHFIGPALVRKEHPAIVYEGVADHQDLGEYGQRYDCLMMPFQVTPLVEAVDPVKLYEYIAMGSCIVSVYYEGLKQFEPYVYFYRTREEYVELLETLSEKGFPAKFTRELQERFLQENSWSQRVRVIEEHLAR